MKYITPRVKEKDTIGRLIENMKVLELGELKEVYGFLQERLELIKQYLFKLNDTLSTCNFIKSLENAKTIEEFYEINAPKAIFNIFNLSESIPVKEIYNKWTPTAKPRKYNKEINLSELTFDIGELKKTREKFIEELKEKSEIKDYLKTYEDAGGDLGIEDFINRHIELVEINGKATQECKIQISEKSKYQKPEISVSHIENKKNNRGYVDEKFDENDKEEIDIDNIKNIIKNNALVKTGKKSLLDELKEAVKKLNLSKATGLFKLIPEIKAKNIDDILEED